MAVGYLLKVGDRTTCGGTILTGDACINIEGQPAATESSLVSCGKHPGQFKILGGVGFMNTPSGKAAGTLDSISSCPCSSILIESTQAQKHSKKPSEIEVLKNNVSNFDYRIRFDANRLIKCADKICEKHLYYPETKLSFSNEINSFANRIVEQVAG